MNLDNGEEEALLEIPVSKRDDSGKYAITVSNPFGEDTGLINVIVLGRLSTASVVSIFLLHILTTYAI